MTNVQCPTQPKFLQGYSVRVTQLDDCGNPEFGECAYAVSDGFIQVTLTPNIADGDEFQQKNAHGIFMTNQRSRRQLNWYDVSIQFREVDYELYAMLTGNPTIVNDASPPETIGIGVTASDFATSNVAIELWMGQDEEPCGEDGLPWYGYDLIPWFIDGAVSEEGPVTNGMINFTLTGRSRKGTPWGVGPWDVLLSSVTGDPMPLFSPVPTDAYRWGPISTQVPPPDPTCGCKPLISS